MAIGNYGINRLSDVAISDIEIWYSYSASRNVPTTKLQELTVTDVLSTQSNPNNIDSTDEVLPGFYTLKLSTDIFNAVGIYTVLIKPKEIRTTISDVGVLLSYPDIKGLVLDYSVIQSLYPNSISNFENDGLIGYRIEYLDTDNPNKKVNNLSKIITSNNFCEAVTQNITNSNQKAIRYRFNDNSSQIFLTLTSSSASSVKPNVTPFIGEVGQKVILTNTNFDPIMLEIEMVSYDSATLANVLLGNQTRSINDGKVTYYNPDTNEIIQQFNTYQINDEIGNPLVEVKEKVSVIDNTKEWNTVTNI